MKFQFIVRDKFCDYSRCGGSLLSNEIIKYHSVQVLDVLYLGFPNYVLFEGWYIKVFGLSRGDST